LDRITTTFKTAIVSDFNAHSTKWGYTDTNRAVNTLTDFILSNNVNLIEEEPGLSSVTMDQVLILILHLYLWTSLQK